MKTETMVIYTCEFCGKYYKTKYCKFHETYCKQNPNNKHKCFEFCNHLERIKEAILDYNGERTTGFFPTSFWCRKKNTYLYSYIAEKNKHPDLNDCNKMPLECRDYDENFKPEEH